MTRSTIGSISPARFKCPNCGGDYAEVIRRKYIVTALVRCASCDIQFRVPTDPPGFADKFYQEEYQSGFTTDCPDEQELATLKSTHFRNSTKDFSSRASLLSAFGAIPGMTILDFGASWGYGTWQLQEAGFEVTGYELSLPRARYARERLGTNVVSSLDTLKGPFDIFFSCHVLEHVPSVSAVVQRARELLRPGGLFVAITPNGSQERMLANPAQYHRTWGAVHPLYLDVRFYQREFEDTAYLIASSQLDHQQIRDWDRSSQLILDVSGDELIVAAMADETTIA